MGRLVLVATPIGNLGDLSRRAIEELAHADAIVCEDTRRTGRLLQHAGIERKPLLVANEHTEASCGERVLELLDGHATVALVSDAGTPAISDPGERIVRAAIAHGHDVTVVPGPVAAIAALVVSGLPTARFVIDGFLPRSGTERRVRIAAAAAERRTVVLYEAPHRLARTLADLADACGGERRVVIARELTKMHEEIWRGTLADAAARAGDADPIGEHVIVLAGCPPAMPASDDQVAEAVAIAIARGISPSDAADQVARSLGVAKRRAYRAAVSARTRSSSQS